MKMKKATPAGALLRKDIFRFAPLWGGYFAIGLAVLLYVISVRTSPVEMQARMFINSLSMAAIVNVVYAGLVAILLFGDLFSAKRCEALHAMPIPREKWFFSHLLHGLLYSFAPNLVAALCIMPILEELWYIGFVWLLGMTLQYLFFFGLAVLCVFLSGNHIGMLLFYGIFNMAGMVAQWFASAVLGSLLYGIRTADGWMSWLCPVTEIYSICQERINSPNGWYGIALPEVNGGYSNSVPVHKMGFNDGWGYISICAGIGVALMGIALLLYRKRKLECAGELLAQKWSSPVFSVLLSLSLGAGLAMLDSFVAADMKWVLLALGMVIGWFGGQMLLHRSVKIFQAKVFLGFAVLVICLASTIGLTIWDPAGITRYIPEADQVQSVELTVKSAKYKSNPLVIASLTTDDPEEIQKILHAHQLTLDNRQEEGTNPHIVTIQYTRNNGTKIIREYKIGDYILSMKAFVLVFSSPKRLLMCEDEESWKESITEVKYKHQRIGKWYNDYWERNKSHYRIPAEIIQQEFLVALLADCEEEKVAAGAFQYLANYPIEFRCKYIDDQGVERGFGGGISRTARHVNAWYEKYRDLFEEG